MATNEQRREAAKRKLAAQQARRAERAQKQKRNTTIAVVATVLVVAVAAGGVYALTAAWGGGEAEPADPAAQAQQNSGPDTSGLPVAPLPVRPTALPASVDCAYPAEQPAAKPVDPPAEGATPAEGTVQASFTTSAGTIDLTLDRALAPCTVKSFESLIEQGYYDGTSCHRLTTSPGLQVLQCGDPTGQGSGGPGYTIPDEVFDGLTYGRGMLAMAKTAAPDSGGSQFFMIYGDAQLPPEYTVFGSIGEEGLRTLDAVARAGESTGGGDGTPNTPVDIEGATVG
ncbi:peptidylprolyl isomerase [Pseudonocardia sp. NPDC049635]|uniref:peptidylprolyl isomerase n=1 Tax=Pseudonocardia sp. NPDC049635 TaxID=3155506 RepID=UPI0033FD381B